MSLAIIAGVLAIFNLVVHLASPNLAAAMVSDYIPLTAELLDARAGASDCLSGVVTYWQPGGREPCLPNSAGWNKQRAYLSAAHRDAWERDVLKPAQNSINNGMISLFAIAYAILLLLALAALFQWLMSRLAGPLRQGIASASNGQAALNEALVRRRFHQTEKDFLSLKTLYDNGLLTEQEFLKRKSELAAALQPKNR